MFGGANLTGAIPINLNACDGIKCVEIDGAAAGDAAGTTITTADINGDGYKDIVICAPNASNNGAASGSCYVIWGHKGSWPSLIDLLNLN